MKRSINTLVLAAASVTVSVAGTIPALACDGRGGNRAFVSVGRRHYPVVRQPVYRSHYQPVCAEPQVVPGPPSFPLQVQPLPPAQGLNPQPGMVSNPALADHPGQAVNGQLPSANGQTRPAARSATLSSAPAETARGNQAETSALQMLVSITAKRTTATETPAGETASKIPPLTATPSAAEASHIGNWKVNLPGNQSVELTLNADGSFVWTASKDGKANTFDGQFRLESGRLTLVRSSDLQQMTGSWSGSEKQYTFKLDGATTGGLAFQRR